MILYVLIYNLLTWYLCIHDYKRYLDLSRILREKKMRGPMCFEVTLYYQMLLMGELLQRFYFVPVFRPSIDTHIFKLKEYNFILKGGVCRLFRKQVVFDMQITCCIYSLELGECKHRVQGRTNLLGSLHQDSLSWQVLTVSVKQPEGRDRVKSGDWTAGVHRSQKC